MDIGRRLSLTEEDRVSPPIVDAMFVDPTTPVKAMERSSSRGRLTGGALSAAWSIKRNSSETFDRDEFKTNELENVEAPDSPEL